MFIGLAALLLAAALEDRGHDCEVQAFSSNGRREVVTQPIKRFGEACGDPLVLARAQAVESRWSTRMGAAVRHAAAALGCRRGHARRVLLVTDGEPYDIDIHDPRYLVADLRHAVVESARQGVFVACVNVGASAMQGDGSPMRRAFAPAAYQAATHLADFPASAAAALRAF